MSEEARAINGIAFWYAIFLIVFMGWIIIFTIIGMRVVNEFSAYNQCASIEDDVAFGTCYEAAKQ